MSILFLDWHLSRDDDAESCELFEDVITRPQSKDEQVLEPSCSYVVFTIKINV